MRHVTHSFVKSYSVYPNRLRKPLDEDENIFEGKVAENYFFYTFLRF